MAACKLTIAITTHDFFGGVECMMSDEVLGASIPAKRLAQFAETIRRRAAFQTTSASHFLERPTQLGDAHRRPMPAILCRRGARRHRGGGAAGQASRAYERAKPADSDDFDDLDIMSRFTISRRPETTIVDSPMLVIGVIIEPPAMYMREDMRCASRFRVWPTFSNSD